MNPDWLLTPFSYEHANVKEWKKRVRLEQKYEDFFQMEGLKFLQCDLVEIYICK